MSRSPRREPDEQRRRLFRQMEWVFVYGPPVVAVLIAVFGSAFLAWVIRIPETEFWHRWLAGIGLLLGLPLLAYVVRQWWEQR